MNDHRNLSRITIRRKGFLKRHEETMVCEIRELTEQGLQIVTGMSLSVGETPALEVQLVDDTVIHCVLLVTHAQGRRIGARIVQISPEHHRSLIRFLELMRTEDRTGPGSHQE